MKLYSLTLSVLLILLTFGTFAQREEGLLLKSGTYHPTLFDKTTDASFTTNELVNGAFYRILQFNEIPGNDAKAAMQQEGIQLLEYLPRNAFYARINADVDFSFVDKYNVYSVSRIAPAFKLSKKLTRKEYPHWALFGADQIELNAIYYEGVETAYAHAELEKLGALILSSNYMNVVEIRLPIAQLEALYALPAFYFFETALPPQEPENLDGRTNHRSNTLATDYATGTKYDGTGMHVMMQDDGYIGDHIDYEGRVDQSGCSGCSNNDSNNHGDHVAGTIMGAGNLNPRYRGMAFGATLHVFEWTYGYNNMPSHYANDSIYITSKSYSSGCNEYNTEARTLDDQIYTMPKLIHVFSAGNNGTGDCSYGAGSGWGNITGGHKQGKNVIAVGNLSTTDALNGSSSRGPAEDGRIKPDICGVGTSVMSTISDYTYDNFTGTSMSCPGVAGTVTQLYHAYKSANGVEPNSALIKAAILNTAEDLGNPGPDFEFGWGRINARRAQELISQNNYQTSNVSTGATNSHNVNVIAGTTRLKVMVYWADYRGSTTAAVTLVNDLNMTVTDPGMVTYQPLVLNSSPSVAALTANAVPGVDNLNNAEQIVIDNPVPGTYVVDIDGFAVPQGPQTYYVVYEMERDEVDLTYPLGGEGFHPGTLERIRWDASEGTASFELEYTLDNGATWSPITTASASDRSYSWVVPTAVSGLAKVRVTRGVNTSQSAAVFSIIETPANLEVDWACPDSLSLVWDPVPGAIGYEVSMLGAKYMDSIGTSIDTNFTVIVPSTSENWYSVRALGPDNARSERQVAIRKLPGEFDCLWSTPTANYAVNCDPASSTGCVDFTNQSINTGPTSTFMWYFPNGTPATSTLENPTVCFGSPGYQDIALVVTNMGGSDSVYFTNALYVEDARDLPFHEGFENFNNFSTQTFWEVYNPDNNSKFTVSNSAALSGVNAARLTNYLQADGDIDELISGPIDLSPLDPVSDIVTLSFRYSFRKKFSTDDDWLRVLVKDVCDGNWTIRKTIHGSMLSPDTQLTSWTPSDSTDWTTVHVTNITGATYFTGDFRFKFQFECGGGNNFYLDDINIYSGGPSETVVSGLEDLSYMFGLEVYPNPTSGELNVPFKLAKDEQLQLEVIDITGKVLQSHTLQGKQGPNIALVDAANLASGSYFVSLISANGKATKRFVVE